MCKLKLKNVPMGTSEECVNLPDGNSDILNYSGNLDDSGDLFIIGGSHTLNLHSEIVDVNVRLVWDSGIVHIPAPGETDINGKPVLVNNTLPISSEIVSYSSQDVRYEILNNDFIFSGEWSGAVTIAVGVASTYRNKYSNKYGTINLFGEYSVPNIFIESEKI